jgi:hypothetical protein
VYFTAAQPLRAPSCSVMRAIVPGGYSLCPIDRNWKLAFEAAGAMSGGPM